MNTVMLALPIAALYALVAASVVIVYRSTRIVNFAIGELVVLAGYSVIAMEAARGLGLSVVFLLSGAAVLGLLVHRVLIQPVTGEGPVVGILITIGLSIFTLSVIVSLFGGRIRRSPSTLAGSVDLGALGFIRLVDLVGMLVALVVFLALGWVFRSTTFGRQMRAVAEKPLLASQRGIDVTRISGMAWALALVVAAIAGLFLGLRSTMGVQVVIVGIKGIVAALIGGLDSLRGAAGGAIILALAEVVAVQNIDARASDAVPFMVLLVVLLVRPWGLFGTAEELERV